MASKLVADYAQAAGTLIDALRAHASEAGDGVGASLGSMIGPDEKVPDVRFLAELLARRLEHDRAELERAEQQKGAEHADTHEPRAARDIAAHELYATLLEVKRTVGALFGPEWVKKLQIPAEFRQNGVAQLLRAGRDVMKALKERALPKPQIDGVKSIDPKPWQKRLRQAVKDLEAANATLGAEKDELDAANVAKATAVANFERTFAAASTIASGLLLLAARDDAAERIPREPRRRHKPLGKTKNNHQPTDGVVAPDPMSAGG